MRIQDYAAVLMKGTHEAFPHVDKPFHVHTDYPWQSGVGVWAQNSSLVCDYDLQAVYPAPLRVPHNQSTGGYYLTNDCGGGALPSFDWQINAGSAVPDFRCNQPFGFHECYIKTSQASADLSYVDLWWEGVCQGITFLWNRFDQNEGNTLLPNVEKFTTFRIGVGFLSQGQVLYSVRFIGRGDCRISKSFDGGVTWIELETIPAGADVWETEWGSPDPEELDQGSGDPNRTPTDLPGKYNLVEFRLIAGRLSVRINSQDKPFVFEEARIDQNNEPVATINFVQVRAYKFVNIAFSAHPMKFTRFSSFDSQEIPIGFYSEFVGQPYIDPAGPVPLGWDAFLDTDPNRTYLFGPIVFYRMWMVGPPGGLYKGTEYSDTVAAVRAVNLFWQPSVTRRVGLNRNVYPEEVSVSHTFNPDSLTVDSIATLSMNNNRPINLPTGELGWWGEWMANYGQTALQVGMARTTMSGSTGPAYTAFTGYGHAKGEAQGAAGDSRFVMTATDRKRQLQNPRFALPWMDGWNVFYAIGYLAQLGGVDISDMRFGYLIPPSPFLDYGDEDGQPAYFLPVGSAGSMLTRFSGVDLWEVMTKLAFAIGYMLFFDVEAQLQFRKFRVPYGVKRSFFESDRESAGGFGGYGGPGGAEGCWSLAVGKNMDEVRTDVIVVGIDAFAPKYDPVVFKYFDDDAVYNMNAFNHLGYRNPAVWVDSQFASPYFAQKAAQQMFQFLRVPGFNVSFTTWLQPDVFPLDVVAVQSYRFGSAWTRLMVMSVTHTVTKELGHSTVHARYVPIFKS